MRKETIRSFENPRAYLRKNRRSTPACSPVYRRQRQKKNKL